MDFVKTVEADIEYGVSKAYDFTTHHFGLVLILVAWITLMYSKYTGKAMLSKYFFVLYGAGSMILAYNTHKNKGDMTLVMLDVFIGVMALVAGFI